MKIAIIGFFSDEEKNDNGQANKTRTISNSLSKDHKVFAVNTANWKSNPIKLFIDALISISRSNAVVMLPAQNGVEVFSRVLYCFRKRKKIYYSVIGGWLPEKVEKSKKLRKMLSKFNGIWVETEKMKDNLSALGLNNISVVPNFKDISIVNIETCQQNFNRPYPVCTFSRVVKEKGIEDAIAAIVETNKKLGCEIYRLDIYGAIDKNYKKEFEMIMETAPQYIRYCGVKKQQEIVDTLKNYFLLLFPTYYPGEGMAGTLIDSLASGLPIVASNWRYNAEIVSEDVGWLFQTHNVMEICDVLCRIASDPEGVLKKRSNCINKAEKFTIEEGIKKLSSLIY